MVASAVPYDSPVTKPSQIEPFSAPEYFKLNRSGYAIRPAMP
jgi:hypothetical protein